MKMKTLLAAAVAAFVLLASPALARKNNSTEPGKYKDWNDELIDRLRIKKTFQLAEYEQLLIVPADIEDAKLPEKDDDDEEDFEEVMGVAKNTRKLILRGIEDSLEDEDIDIAKSAAEEAEGLDRTLVLKGNLVDTEPGPRAARILVGFGAGGA